MEAEKVRFANENPVNLKARTPLPHAVRAAPQTAKSPNVSSKEPNESHGT